jgi:hypothetical protein
VANRHALRSQPGPGFCYSAASGFCLHSNGFGPLLIAFDSNIISDLEQHGRSILDEVPATGIDQGSQVELDALGQILEIWRTRDIRFIVVPQTLKDHRREPPPELSEQRRRSYFSIIEALAYQVVDDSSCEAFAAATAAVPDPNQLALNFDPGGLLKPLDAQMIREAIACEVDVFLTNDRQLRNAVRRLNLPVHALSPSELMRKFDHEHVGLVGEDHVRHASCGIGFSLLCDDTGKWGPLFEILEGGEV